MSGTVSDVMSYLKDISSTALGMLGAPSVAISHG